MLSGFSRRLILSGRRAASTSVRSAQEIPERPMRCAISERRRASLCLSAISRNASLPLSVSISFSEMNLRRFFLLDIYAGAGTIVGHCFPVYMQFRGGKGVACFGGFVIAAAWPLPSSERSFLSLHVWNEICFCRQPSGFPFRLYRKASSSDSSDFSI